MNPKNVMNQKTKSVHQAEQAAIRWLVRLNSPDLSEDQQAEFFVWLKASQLHQNAYIKAENLWARGAVLQYVKTPPKPLTRQTWGWGLACACLLLLAISITYLKQPLPQEAVFRTAVGEQREILLEDGSRLVLNTGSEIHFELQPKRRLARLVRGEVFFEIAKDQRRPFDVLTEVGMVRVLGTRFAVQALADDALVTVIEGKVGLGQAHTAEVSFTPAVTLTADQRLSLNSATSGLTPKSIDATSELAWRQQQLIYRGESLADVIDDLSRYFPETILLADPALQQMEVSAVIRLADSNVSLSALAQALNLQAEFSQDKKTIVLKHP